MRPDKNQFVRTAFGLAWALSACGSCDHSTAPAASARPARIVMPGALSLGLHAPYQFSPVVLDDAGRDITTSTQLHWTTSDAAVALVDPAGLLTGVALGGPVTITGSVGGVTATATVTVVPADVTITPVIRGVALNTTQQMSAQPRDYFGVPVAATVVWSSLNPDIATIESSTGLLTAVAAGNAIVAVTAAGRTESFTFFVDSPSPLDGVYDSDGTTDPVELRVFLGHITDFTATYHTRGCAVQVSAHPDAIVSNASRTDSTVANIPEATFTTSDGSTIVGASFATLGTVAGHFTILSGTNHDCTAPPGSTVPPPYFAVRP